MDVVIFAECKAEYEKLADVLSEGTERFRKRHGSL